MLVRVALEGFGAAARALGPAMAHPGTLLRLMLLPTLERIGEHASIRLTTDTTATSLSHVTL